MRDRLGKESVVEFRFHERIHLIAPSQRLHMYLPVNTTNSSPLVLNLGGSILEIEIGQATTKSVQNTRITDEKMKLWKIQWKENAH
jgi:hypothetical protein